MAADQRDGGRLAGGGAEEFAIHDHENFGGVEIAEYAGIGRVVEIPQALRNYIDYEAMARDAVLNGEVFTVETAHDQVHAFWTH